VVSRESLLETLQPGPPPPVRITLHYTPLPMHISRRRGPHDVAFASFFPTALPRRHGEPPPTRAWRPRQQAHPARASWPWAQPCPTVRCGLGGTRAPADGVQGAGLLVVKGLPRKPH